MTNNAAIGYAILAAKQMGLAGDKLVELEDLMRIEMDRKTEEEAEQAYREY